MKSLTVAYYDDCLLATGLLDDGTVSPIYVSRDGGNVWRKDDNYPLPSNINGSDNENLTPYESVKLFADDDNRLWIVVNDRAAWCGRINRLGWK